MALLTMKFNKKVYVIPQEKYEKLIVNQKKPETADINNVSNGSAGTADNGPGHLVSAVTRGDSENKMPSLQAAKGVEGGLLTSAGGHYLDKGGRPVPKQNKLKVSSAADVYAHDHDHRHDRDYVKERATVKSMTNDEKNDEKNDEGHQGKHSAKEKGNRAVIEISDVLHQINRRLCSEKLRNNARAIIYILTSGTAKTSKAHAAKATASILNSKVLC